MARRRRNPSPNPSSEEIEEANEETKSEQEVIPPPPHHGVVQKRLVSRARGINIAGPSSPGNRVKLKQVARRGLRPPLDSDDDDLRSPPANAPVVGPLVIRPAVRVSPSQYIPPREVDYTLRGGAAKLRKSQFVVPTLLEPEVLANDSRFHNLVHIDYYNSIIIGKKSHPVVLQRWINWEGCKDLQHPDLICALARLEKANLKSIMTYDHSWTNEAIYQFYATVWFDEGNEDLGFHPCLHFMIEGKWYACSYRCFARILGFDDVDINKSTFDSFPKPKSADVEFMYLLKKACGIHASSKESL